ncbi:MAG: diguanylate cyclase [Clostridiaceae bacterium]|nr:diguanylate cyclase [Clostridiaceae bacterium]
MKCYFNTVLKRFELITYLVISSFITYLQITGGESYGTFGMRGLLGQTQSLVFVLMAFRFGYFGCAIAAMYMFFDIYNILTSLYHGSDRTLVIGVTQKILTIVVISFVALLTNRQEGQKRKLERLSIIDELTDAYNQRFFHMIIDSEIEKARKSQLSVGLIMLDIDNFKMYNDIYGHDCGDTILKCTSSILKRVIGGKGYICRYGGDEFAAIFTNTDLKSLERLANNIREEFEANKCDYFRKDLCEKVTLSIGLSEYPNMSKSKNELIYQADMALYHAKNLGKDKVHLYQDVILQIRKNISSDHQQLIGIFRGLLSTISAKDTYTHGHCERVSSYAVMIGEALGLDLRDISIIQYAGLLHDIGKVEIPKSVLNKKGKLSKEEIFSIHQHPVYSENILEPLKGMDQLVDYVRHHHERYDGSGYPDGLRGDQISLGARILCVADSFDAMISDRPYSKSMTLAQALNELKLNSGLQFDPDIVNIFSEIIKSKAAAVVTG